MHVLITTDTVGGVWTFTQELVTGLAQRGHKVTLVSFGRLPTADQITWLRQLKSVDFRPTEYGLEWMEVAERDIEESRRYLGLVIREVQPDILHLSQYCYGDIDADVPRIVVAHSDVVSWWVAVHGCEPDSTPWMQRYREHVTNGLRAADLVVAPSQWMLDAVMRHYLKPQHGAVIYNGRSPELFDPYWRKQDFVLSVGRVWDEAKHASLLLKIPEPVPTKIVGWIHEPGREKRDLPFCPVNVELLGPKSQADLREIYSQASVYVATSRYEPFGLSPLEAALSRCTLLMNDVPVFHELWGDAALFFRKDDPADLSREMTKLRRYPEIREQFAERAFQRACQNFSASRMVAEYESSYDQVTSRLEKVG